MTEAPAGTAGAGAAASPGASPAAGGAPPGWLAAIGPGILVAATGVGAGDLITASLAGAEVGSTVLWAVLVGALLKWFLTEGLARWQMATGQTLLEGWVTRLGSWIQWVFLLYLVLWTFVVAGALINACGTAGDALWPLSSDPRTSRAIWGTVHALAGLALVWRGNFDLFERCMSVAVAVMFCTVFVAAWMVRPDWAAAARGATTPVIPPSGLPWVLGLLGGVGGTLTLLSYGYWIQEAGRRGAAGLRACRIDLAVAYALTAAFSVAMVLIGQLLPDTAPERARLAHVLAQALGEAVGPAGRAAFLAGFWGAVFSSLLGVWQGVPYLFADFLAVRAGERPDDLARTPGYRGYLVAMATLPLLTLGQKFEAVQVLYAVLGAFFMPLLAITLLIMNNKQDWVGEHRNGPVTNLALVATVLFFAGVGGRTLLAKLG